MPHRHPRSVEIWRDQPDKQNRTVRRIVYTRLRPKKEAKKKEVYSCQQICLPGSCPPWPDPRRWCSRTPERWCWPNIGGCVRSPGRSAEGTPSPLQDAGEDMHIYIASITQHRHNTTSKAFWCESAGRWKINGYFFWNQKFEGIIHIFLDVFSDSNMLVQTWRSCLLKVAFIAGGLSCDCTRSAHLRLSVSFSLLSQRGCILSAIDISACIRGYFSVWKLHTCRLLSVIVLPPKQ